MLFSAIALSLFAGGYAQTTADPSEGCWDFMEPQMTNQDADNPITINRVNHYVTGFVLPLAIDECTAAGLVSAAEGAYIFSCNEDGSMTRTKYADAVCNNLDDSDTPYSWTLADYPNATSVDPWYYECDGEDRYVVTEVIAGQDCGAADHLRLAVALASCVDNTDFVLNGYCNHDYARIQFFAPGSYCVDPWQCKGNRTVDEGCGPWFATSLGLVSGEMIRCYDGTDPPMSTESEDGAMAMSTAIASLIGLAVAYLH